MELGDLEAAFVGNLARYCMVMGTLPPFSLRGLWWVNGECKGLGVVDWDTDVEPIIPLIHHMQHYAPFIVGTEGVEDLLQAGRETRWYSEKMFPQEAGEWIDLEEASKIADRTPRTVLRWAESGSIRSLGDSEYIEVLKQDVQQMGSIIHENRKLAASNLNRRGANEKI